MRDGRGRGHRRLFRSLPGALYANAAALALLALVLLARGEGAPQLLPVAAAQQPPMAGGGGLYVMPAQLSQTAWGAYLMDIDRQSLMVYQYDPAARTLRLQAARELVNDRRLGNFNTTPDPREIRAIADKERQTERLADPAARPAGD